MALRAFNILFVLACLAGALWYGAGYVSPPKAADVYVSPAEVESAYKELSSALEAGETDEALLELRKRSEKGPYPGAALYFLGQLAYAEGAYPQALLHYRKASEKNPSLFDRGGPFKAREKVLKNLDALKNGPWKGQRPAGIADLQFLVRRLNGGCE
jgi:tetratricopeptide (TPR) repeat protein